MSADPAAPLAAPDLQEWVRRYGGYWNIPWDKWDAAVAAYEIERRAYLAMPTANVSGGARG